jgi:hypothetical protein
MRQNFAARQHSRLVTLYPHVSRTSSGWNRRRRGIDRQWGCGGAGVNRVYGGIGGIGGWLYGSTGAPTSVNVPVLTIPISAGGLKFMLAGQTPGYADGILGIGPNATAPGPSSVTTALPGNLNQGVLFNEPQGHLQFGPNPLPGGVPVVGAPFTTLGVSINNGPLQPVSAVVDSGAERGYLRHTLLYSYTTTEANSPTVISGDQMNTGNTPFAIGPVYISYSPSGDGTTTFYPWRGA